MNATTTLELTNIGPIEKLSLPIPVGGGIVVLTGANDLGKSETIDAVAAAVTGKGKLEARRGTVGGTLSGFGVNIRVGAKTTRTGQPVVTSLEGRFSIEDLIDPKIKDPVAADAKRIKALVQIAGAKADPSLFYDLLGGREQLEKFVIREALEGDDVVVMADRIKRALESEARKQESQAEHAEGHARGAADSCRDVDTEGNWDSAALQRDLETAIRNESSLKAQAEAATKAAKARQNAEDALSDAEAAWTGGTAEHAAKLLATCQNSHDEALADVRDLESKLMAARAKAESLRGTVAQAKQNLASAEQHEATIAKWREQLAADQPTAPTADELSDASAAVTQARNAVEQGVTVRKARESKIEAEKQLAAASLHRKTADRLRNAAKGTDGVLSGLVAKLGTPFRIEMGRLMLDDDKGNPKTYAERSHGTRSKVALDVAIEAVGEHGVIPLSQEYWEGIQPSKRLELARHVAGRGVLVITAEATDDEEITPVVVGT